MRAYCKLHPPTKSKVKNPSVAGERILSRDPTIQVNFTPPEVSG
jgi:hypothetical protein